MWIKSSDNSIDLNCINAFYLFDILKVKISNKAYKVNLKLRKNLKFKLSIGLK